MKKTDTIDKELKKDEEELEEDDDEPSTKIYEESEARTILGI